MKYIFNICMAVIVSLLMITQVKAQNQPGVVISQFGKMELHKAIANIGRLDVEGDIIYLVSKEGERLGFAKIEVGLCISFEEIDEETTDITTLKGTNLCISFRQSSDIIMIQGLNHDTTARIFTPNGQLISTTALSSGNNRINVHSVKQGIYLLQIDTQVFKLIKK